MGLRVSNPASLKAMSQLQKTQKAIARSLERMSSGLRVNSPRDDARAFVLGVSLTSQIRGLSAANLGINTALGIVNTASAAMSSQLEILQGMRELALRASNGTLTNVQRENLDEELQALYSEYNRITRDTNFNGTSLLDGSFGLKTIQLSGKSGDRFQFGIDSTVASGVFIQRTTVNDGTFQNQNTFSTVDGEIRTVSSGDFNEDGKLDLVTANYSDRSLSVLLGNGNGTFRAATTLGAGSSSVKMAFTADLNNDGKLDLIAADDYVSIYYGNGNGTFQARFTTAQPTPNQITAEDFNGDGKLDLIGFRSGIGSIVLGNGNGTFGATTTVAGATISKNVIAVDLNGDGILDVLTSDPDVDTVSIFLGNGNGTFKARATINMSSGPLDVRAADFNGDGILDLITAGGYNDTASIALGNGNGTFKARTTVRTGWYPIATNIIDINGDGKLDLLVADANDDTTSIFFGNGNGTFATRKTIATGDYPTSIASSDVSGDGIYDLVVANRYDNNVSVMLGNSHSVSDDATISLLTQTLAENFITAIDSAISSITSYQANLGAIHSRLSRVIAGNLLMSENLEEARSNAIDTDYSFEVAELVRNQILQSAQIAVLTQANVEQELVLKVLDLKN